MTSSTGHDPDRIARSWVGHLRAGGSTPWSEWEYDDQPADAAGEGRIPGAASLEVVRRLAEHRAGTELVGAGDFTALADVVLRRTGPGRGMGEIPLARKGFEQATDVGTPPADPADVPVEELVRVGIGALAELLVTGPPAPQPAPHPASQPAAQPAAAPSGRRRWPWSTSFRLLGAPAARSSARAVLAANGHVEGGRRPTVLVLADPLEDMLAQVWSARVQRGATMRWPRLLANLVRADRLPPAVDLAQVTARWADLVGPDRVHVLVGGDSGVTVGEVAAGLLGLRLRKAAHLGDLDALPEPIRLPGPPTEVLRRLNAVLTVRVPAARHHALLRRAAGLLYERASAAPHAGSAAGSAAGTAAGSAADSPAAPPAAAAWVRARAEQMCEQLLAGGYAVHGDPERLAAAGGAPLRRSAVLDVVLDACLRAARDNRSQEVPGS